MKNEVKERPILFTGGMVRAILDGRKSHTRRICKPWYKSVPFPSFIPDVRFNKRRHWAFAYWEVGERVFQPGTTYFAVPGDILWVRETWAKTGDNFHDDWPGHGDYYYRADDPYSELEPDSPTKGIPKWRASIYMPREASRIRLLIEDIGVERLNDISQSDAVSEGIESSNEFNSDEGYLHQYKDYIVGDYELDAICSYQTLWESINGKGSWDKNPFVWVIKFHKL